MKKCASVVQKMPNNGLQRTAKKPAAAEAHRSPAYSMNEILNGNSYELVKQLDANSVDLLLTDPPYGISFMGKHWDRAVPPVEFWADCLRVLKPGAFAFVMSLPRQDCLARMIISLEEAGFVTAFTSIYWTFASGFPKAANISKLVDKQAGVERDVLGLRVDADGRCRAAEPHGKKVYDGAIIKDLRPQTQIKALTVPATPQAQALNGAYAGFQPKPAVEIILVAMKPLTCDTYVEQALTNGKGVTWLDDGRIPLVWTDRRRDLEPSGNKDCRSQSAINFKTDGTNRITTNPQSRFPANLLVSDDVLNDGIVRFSGNGGIGSGSGNYTTFKGLNGFITSCYADSGSYSRYFDIDAWFAERLKLLPEAVQKTFPWLIVPKPSKREKNAGLENMPERVAGIGDERPSGQSMQRLDGRNPRKVQNHHPTVKPLKLMSYLLTIGSRPGDVVLDPFSGSGTTAVACQMWNRRFIAMEQESEFVELAQARLRACQQELNMNEN